MKKQTPPTLPPIKFLLEASDSTVGNFELAKLDEVASLRSEMLATLENLRREMVSMFDGIIERATEQIRNQEGMFDRLVDETAQAALAAMLRRIDRQELVRQLLESSTVTLDAIMAEARAEIRNQGRSKEEAEDCGKMPSPWLIRPHMSPDEARKARAAKTVRYQERNIAEGKCQCCPAPLCRESARYCAKHLAMYCANQRKRRGTVVHGRGQHPRSIAALRKLAEKRKKT